MPWYKSTPKAESINSKRSLSEVSGVILYSSSAEAVEKVANSNPLIDLFTNCLCLLVAWSASDLKSLTADFWNSSSKYSNKAS